MKYRAEIDGLRALAVVPVILFHAGFAPFSGGFVGVDVFFVISGYLITTIIVREIEEGAFSLRRFYERRARRILPALFFVCAACVPFAWAWMDPVEFRDFAGSLVAVGLFASNVFFWMRSDYFAADADMQPLLHTWSLAVEEQFYVLFPLLAVLLARSRRAFVVVLAAATLVSLGLAEYASRVAPEANFYLLPTRAWELAVGALAALWLRGRQPAEGMAAQVGAAIGLGLIVLSIFWFGKNMRFPSLWAVLPVAGAALVIVYATPATLAGRVLALRPLVAVGLVSYSAYLWHQPIFAFARIGFGNPSGTAYAALALAVVPISYLSWRFVEQPFRTRSILPGWRILAAAGCATAVCLAVGATFRTGVLAPERFKGEAARMIEEYAFYPRESYYREMVCFLGPDQSADAFRPTCYDPASAYVMWGDSHAAALYLGLSRRAAEAGLAVNQLTSSGCPPILGFEAPARPHCKGINDHIFARLASTRGTLVLHANWLSYKGDPKMLPLFAATLDALRARGTRFVVVLSVPQWQPSAPAVFNEAPRRVGDDGVYLLRNALFEDIAAIDAEIVRLLRPGELAIDLQAALCEHADDGNYCRVAHRIAGKPILWQWDYGHFTVEGSLVAGAHVFDRLPPPD